MHHLLMDQTEVLLGCFSTFMFGAVCLGTGALAAHYYGPWWEGCRKRHHRWKRTRAKANGIRKGKVTTSVSPPRVTAQTMAEKILRDCELEADRLRAVHQGEGRCVNPPATVRVWARDSVSGQSKGHWWTGAGTERR